MRLDRLVPRLLLAASPVLLWLAFRHLPPGALGHWISGLTPGALGLLIGFEILAFFLMGERWRYLLREAGASAPFLLIQRSRLAGFAWSYLTPGPHFGGEPVQFLIAIDIDDFVLESSNS